MAYCHAVVRIALAIMLLLAAGVAQANVFSMPGGLASLQFVTVGDPGNAADTMGTERSPTSIRWANTT